MSAEDYRLTPEPDLPACPKCRSTELVAVTPPQGDPHRRWLCVPCDLLTTGSKAEAWRHAQARLVEARERGDAARALARRREQERVTEPDDDRCICTHAEEAIYVEPGCPVHAPGCSIDRCAYTPARHCCGEDYS